MRNTRWPRVSGSWLLPGAGLRYGGYLLRHGWRASSVDSEPGTKKSHVRLFGAGVVCLSGVPVWRAPHPVRFFGCWFPLRRLLAGARYGGYLLRYGCRASSVASGTNGVSSANFWVWLSLSAGFVYAGSLVRYGCSAPWALSEIFCRFQSTALDRLLKLLEIVNPRGAVRV